MSYWICSHADIIEGGRLVSLEFKDPNTGESSRIQTSAENWANLFVYKDGYDAPQRRIADLHMQIADIWLKQVDKHLAEKEGKL